MGVRERESKSEREGELLQFMAFGTISLSEEASLQVRQQFDLFHGKSLICRLVGSSPPRQKLRDWIRTALVGEEQLRKLIFVGRGIFILVFASEVAAQSLLSRCPLSIRFWILFAIPWYPDFEVATFDDLHQVPRFPTKIFFPDLPVQFRVPTVLQQFGSLYGTPFLDSIDVESITPSLKVASTPSQGFPDFLHFEWEGVIQMQSLRVTGRPDQCHYCHAFGHLVRDCPKGNQRRQRQRQQAFQRPKEKNTPFEPQHR